MIPTIKQNYAAARDQAKTELIQVTSEHNALCYIPSICEKKNCVYILNNF